MVGMKIMSIFVLLLLQRIKLLFNLNLNIMKNLFKLLLISLVLTMSSCGGSDDVVDPQPEVVVPQPIITPKVTMSVVCDENLANLVFTLFEKVNKPTKIAFNSNLKSSITIIIPANELSYKHELGTTTTNTTYTITSINDVAPSVNNDIITQECVDLKLLKFLNCKIIYFTDSIDNTGSNKIVKFDNYNEYLSLNDKYGVIPLTNITTSNSIISVGKDKKDGVYDITLNDGRHITYTSSSVIKD